MKSFETYRFKARLTKAAHKALDEALEVNRLLYNAANEERAELRRKRLIYLHTVARIYSFPICDKATTGAILPQRPIATVSNPLINQ